ncbi:MAG: hypothetical protein HZB72_05000 [Burkholderiales bacterium]|nr:hypothetical protein [Burkholderiales bacterium]
MDPGLVTAVPGASPSAIDTLRFQAPCPLLPALLPLSAVFILMVVGVMVLDLHLLWLAAMAVLTLVGAVDAARAAAHARFKAVCERAERPGLAAAGGRP